MMELATLKQARANCAFFQYLKLNMLMTDDRRALG